MDDVDMEKQIETVARAYDTVLAKYIAGADPMADVPPEVKDNPAFSGFIEEARKYCNGGNPDIRAYLDPQPGMRFLDCGSGANLANYGPGEWPSRYYGCDISAGLVGAMKGYARREGIDVGGLWVGDISEIPFEDGFFDIAALIGVLEYCSLEYIDYAFAEITRVLKKDARVVLDIPDETHRYYPFMLAVEEALKRPIIRFGRSDFEEILNAYFVTDKNSEGHPMIKYFVRSK